MVEQTLEVRGHEDVHAGRSGLIELPLCGVSTGGKEVGQDVVLVGGADQLADGQAHLLCIVAGQNIAEVSGGDAEIGLVAEDNFSRLEQLGISGEVIDDLRHEAAPVDGIGTGKADVPLGQSGRNGFITEDLLHAGLGVVEIAAHSINGDICTLLRGHLQTLDLAGAARGVEHGDLDARDVVVAVQRGLAGVAAGRHEDEGLFGAGEVLLCLHEEFRHQLKGIILEGTGRAVPQLKGIGIALHRGQITGLAAEGFTISRASSLSEEVFRVVGQIFADDGSGQLRIIQLAQCLHVHLRKAFRDEQAALIRQALCDRLRGGHNAGMVSRAEKFHRYRSFLPKGPSLGLVVRQRSRAVFLPFPTGTSCYFAQKAPFIICTIQRPLSRGTTSATSKRTGSSL